MTGHLDGFHTSGCWATSLPADETCAFAARSQLRNALSLLGLDNELILDANLMASEVCTNALVHGLGNRRHGDGSARADLGKLEMWAYPRLHPRFELVVKVFDPWPFWNHPTAGGDPLAERGRGIKIMNALPFQWGWHMTRSRLAQEPVSGKATWFAIPLTDSVAQPEPLNLTVDQAAQALYHQLAARGIPDLRLEHGFDRWLVSLPSGVTVWSETPSTFRWPAAEGGHHTRPTSELIDVAEIAVRLHEESIVNRHVRQAQANPHV